MNPYRRSFLKKNLLFAGSLVAANSIDAVAGLAKTINTHSVNKSQLNVMYTNDLKGEINPVYRDFGGLQNVFATVNNHEVATLLFDAGGFLKENASSTNQEKTIQLMNKINYHGVNLSAADLVNGLDGFASLLPCIQFPLLSCNYHFEDKNIRNAVKPYQILSYGKFKVGVTGVGEQVKMKGLLVSNPTRALNRVSRILREKHQCDMVICLAHLGFEKNNGLNNRVLAENSERVDLVIGGNAKQSQSKLWIVRNQSKQEVMLSNNHSKGLSLAKMSFDYTTEKERNGLDLQRHLPGLTTRVELHQQLASINAFAVNNRI
ncbi:hypothetical protein [Pedobacter sp. MW01-1-1]|uniref:hypothetical protein n=1 Tax=Pedobacter sp. MW01-1-1 TaxID=3383027 RepID=UPI003FF004CC